MNTEAINRIIEMLECPECSKKLDEAFDVCSGHHPRKPKSIDNRAAGGERVPGIPAIDF